MFVQLAMTRMLLIALERVFCPVIVSFAQLVPQLVDQPPMESALPVFMAILLSVQLALQKIVLGVVEPQLVRHVTLINQLAHHAFLATILRMEFVKNVLQAVHLAMVR